MQAIHLMVKHIRLNSATSNNLSVAYKLLLLDAIILKVCVVKKAIHYVTDKYVGKKHKGHKCLKSLQDACDLVGLSILY